MIKISLAAARTNVKMTQQQVADSLDVSVSTIKNWENGKTSPKVDMAMKLCALYGIEYNNLNFEG